MQKATGERLETEWGVTAEGAAQLDANQQTAIEAQSAGILAGTRAASYAGILAKIAQEREAVQCRLEVLEQSRRLPVERVKRPTYLPALMRTWR